MADEPTAELLVSPHWAASLGDIDGAAHVILRIKHPRFGPLDFLLPNNDAIELAAALEKTWERRDEKRMSSGVAHAPVKPDVTQIRRRARASWWSRLFQAKPSVTSRFTSSPASRATKPSTGSNRRSA